MLLRPWRNAAATCEEAAREPLRRYPITGIGCRCARAATGHAAALPSSVMISRRFMRAPLSPRIAPYHTVVRNAAFVHHSKLWLLMSESDQERRSEQHSRAVRFLHLIRESQRRFSPSSAPHICRIHTQVDVPHTTS